jgi:hypothetical protein
MEPIRIIKQDMFSIKINKEYKVYLIDSNSLNMYPDFFDNFMISYNRKTEDIIKKLYICIDCEFNPKKIINEQKSVKQVALIQINFEEENEGNIFIIDPKILSDKTINILKDQILCNSKISKIFHGADSLDIPYFFYEFFESDKKQIVKFMENYVDTRFLCEYHNAQNKLYNNIENSLCNIYYLYEKYDIINKEQRQILDLNEHKMGKLYELDINIDTLTDELINYTMYDVVYLKFLYKRMISTIKEYSYINEMVHLVYLDKRNIIKFVDKEMIDKFNINYFFRDGKIIRLSELIDSGSTQKLEIFNNKIFNTLFHVNYFKQNLILILKNILYAKTLRRERVFENKTTIQRNQLEYNELFEKLKLYKLNNILNLVINLELP